MGIECCTGPVPQRECNLDSRLGQRQGNDERRWRDYLQIGKPEQGQHQIDFLSYNILADSLAFANRYCYTAPENLDFENRSSKVLEELFDADADILCL